jgi:lysozyme family protein
MAKFEIADQITTKNEDFYSDDPSDRGAETLWGIARNPNPDWEGWKIVDVYRRMPNFPENMRHDVRLWEMRTRFYKKHYWDTIQGDELVNQDSANSAYDFAVNVGVKPAIKMLQESHGLEITGIMDEKCLKNINNIYLA